MNNQVSFKKLRATMKETLGNGGYKKSVLAMVVINLLLLVAYLVMAWAMMVMSRYTLMTLMSSMQYLMMGMGAYVLPSIMMMLLIVAGLFALSVAVYLLGVSANTAMLYAVQDLQADHTKVVNFKAVTEMFGNLNKSQVIRVALYQGLFMWLWTLPFNLLDNFAGNNMVIKWTLTALTYLVLIWKELQYSQSLLILRAQRASLVGQSMRHVVTASKRYMQGLMWNYLGYALLYLGLPVAVLTALAVGSGVGLTQVGAPAWVVPTIMVVLVIVCLLYVPVMLTFQVSYFNLTKSSLKLDQLMVDRLVPMVILTGEQTWDTYQPQNDEVPSKKRKLFARKLTAHRK